MLTSDRRAVQERIREAVRQPELGKTSPDFAEALFANTPSADLADLKAPALAALTHAAWEHLSTSALNRHDLKIVNPDFPGCTDITVVEIVNHDMPFLLDSAMACLLQRGFEPRLVAHPIFAVERRADGAINSFEVAEPGDGRRHESLIHLHIARIEDETARQDLAEDLARTFDDIRAATDDFAVMEARLSQALEGLRTPGTGLKEADIAEAEAFLRWMMDDNFIFIGLRELPLIEGQEATGEGFGILRDAQTYVLRRGGAFVTTTPEIRRFLAEPVPLLVTKASVRSRIHRRAHLDYIGVKLFDAQGRTAGELRMVGLFTATAYTQPVASIPLLRRKFEAASQATGFNPESHSGRALAQIVESYPRDELFQIDADTLARFAVDIVSLYERPRLRILVRPDAFHRFVSVFVFVPRDKYDSDVRARIGTRLAEAFEGRVSAFHPSFLEGVPLTRVHYIIGCDGEDAPDTDLVALEQAIVLEVQTWTDRLKLALSENYEGPAARGLAARYANAFSAGYREAFAPGDALAHIARMEALDEQRFYAIQFVEEGTPDDDRVGLEILSLGRSIPLSERIPVLAAMGFAADDERTFEINVGSERAIWLHDMRLRRANGGSVDLAARRSVLTELGEAVATRCAESDHYNALALEVGLDWREISLLRAVSRYLRQAGIAFSHEYMAGVAVKHAAISARIVALFHARFSPDGPDDRTAAQADVLAAIEDDLANVESLDEDRILRRFVNLVQSMVRTNFYQREADGGPRQVVSFKLEAAKVDALPAPRPLFEIFVSSPRVEGVHLRFGRVARGGLRWSDRPEDFRTEILGLVKAQQVKNAVIVPVGAKGGFVPKRLPPASDRAAWMAEGTEAYKIFISALLDLTDDIEGADNVPPADTVRHDADDSYLVVAADKGTATFSDTANGLAIARGFWLGDAFASGGSVGYDHKKMGITARGAWEAVKRHFREMDIDIQSTPFTAAGVGDMSGDVFGNGMLLSRQTRLVAAFDHRDIFLDPDPDPARSWDERKRLFDLPRSSWRDYDSGLISEGGGVFPRGAKSLDLSRQAQALLGLPTSRVTPQQVMQAILRLDVDLLFFGGIGTYIRASSESDSAVGDRSNDPIRVTGSEIRAKVVGEGANLGATQLGRIEAAQTNVRINTDAIDNSAGVNTSDYEVNIKIGLQPALNDGRLGDDTRSAFLASMTDEIAGLVLANNHRQTLALSLTERRGAEDLGFERVLMRRLEERGLLDRAVEYLPDEAALDARAANGRSLTRPELAVLLAYAKNALYADLLESGVPDDPYLGRELGRYFPGPMREGYRADIDAHRLRREIITTRLANAMIDLGGPSLLPRLGDVGVDEGAAAFAAVRDSFRIGELMAGIDALDAKISGSLQLQLYGSVQDLLLSRMPWFLRNVDLKQGLQDVVARFRAALDEVRAGLGDVLGEEATTSWRARADEFEAAGVPAELASWLAALPALARAPDAVLVAERSGLQIVPAAQKLFATTEQLCLDALQQAASAIAVGDHYERLAIDRALSEIGAAVRALAARPSDHGVILLPEDAAQVSRQLADISRSGLSLAKLTIAADMISGLARS
ncbi:NAD-glutamate dehydrogenase [Terrihabitans sp. B22-R8]|uniref:NAD-glutamate dehydrogenase n=1 Tax=Terrihabitans sp. B22-R8 TaxID=3425128 RepID=UPI00403CDEA4